MTHTSNLNLPQWDRTDRIMMDDFNTAMANIDAHTHAVKLKSFTVTEATATYDMDVSDIDWNQYSKVVVRAYPICGTYAVNFRVNGDATSIWEGVTSDNALRGQGIAHLVSEGVTWVDFLVGYDDQNPILTRYTSANNGGHGYDSTYNYSQFSTLHMFTSSSSNAIAPGSTVDIWGVR